MVQIRQSPSGPPIRGTNIGDQLFWDGAEWRTGPGGAGGQSAWDHIVTDLASWEAAVGPATGGVYSMPSGSYALKGELVLAQDHRITVPNGAQVLFKSMGEKVLRANVPGVAGLTVEPGGTLQAEALIVQNSSGSSSSSAVRCEGTLHSTGCFFRAGAASAVFGATIGGGLWIDFGSHFSGTTEGLRSDALVSDDAEIWLNGTHLSCGFTPGLRACVCIVGKTSTLSLQGAFWLEGLQNNPDGIRLEADLSSLQMNGGEASGLDDAVQYVSGVVQRASIMNFSVSGSVSSAIDWPAANLPSPQGLTLVGNVYNTSGPAHQNFTATDPRVMVRGCLDSGGPMTETPLVP